MFAKKLLLSFTAIAVVFTTDITYSHAKELPKVSFSITPGSYDISESSPGGTHVTTKSPWYSGYMSFVPPDFIQEFSSSLAQQLQSKVEDPVVKPVGVGLNGGGRVPRPPPPPIRAPPRKSPPPPVWNSLFPLFRHRGSPQFRFPPIRPPRVPPPKVWSPRVPPPNVPSPRVPPPPILAPPSKPPPVWTPPSPPPVWTPPPPLTVQPPTIQPPSASSPLPVGNPPFESSSPTPTAEPPSLNPAKAPSPALDAPAISPGWQNYPTASPTVMFLSDESQEFTHLIV